MQITMWCQLVCLLVLTTIVTINSQEVLDRWHWSWVCKSNNRCTRTDFLLTPIEEGLGSTQDICRLTCGKTGSIWPKPTGSTTLSHQVIAFHPSRVKFNYTDVATRSATDYLQTITKIFLNDLLLECGANCTVLPDTDVNIRLSVRYSSLELNWNTDESYRLELNTAGNQVQVHIECKTAYGCRHGLETLSQLITSYSTLNTLNYGGQVLVVITSASITDIPAFPHRGLLLDTARNYLTISAIEKMLDGMAMNKLNVFHWHATDSQSFPLYLPRLPQMSRFGAYSPTKIYSVGDVEHILKYAKDRGIRVIIEIDAPAHAGNGWQWGEAAGLGKLAVCVNQQPWRKFCIQPPCGQLNPTNLNLFNILRELYRDIIEIMPRGEVFHMGGDEVFFPCWNASEEIISWLETNNRGRAEEDFLQLWAEFQATALQVFDDENLVSNTPIVLWSSHLTNPDVIEKYLDKRRYVIQPWVEADNNLPNLLLARGYRVIISTKDKWYLDHGFWGSTLYHSWKVAYDNKLPIHRNVLGGEAAMWGELVDENSVDVKVWPRTAAVAERLWSNPDTNSLYAEPRFQSIRHRMVKRGIRADAISPEWCFQNDIECL